MNKFSKVFFKPTPKNIFLFLVVFFSLGFSLGTFVLLFVVRQVVYFSSGQQLEQSTQDLYINIIIVIYLVISVILSIYLTKYIIKQSIYWLKATILTTLLAVSAFTLWLWLNPEIITTDNEKTIDSENINSAIFDFGAYPSKAQLTKLKKENYSAVISLMHPAVVPFEPKLIADEEVLVKEMGIAYIHIPMLPWVSSNEEALKKISEIIAKGKGKYFVHCYLGKDRVNVVKNFIKNQNGQITNEYVIPESRKLDGMKSFERGEIFKLDNGLYLIPYPTDEEFFGYLLSGSIKQIVSLLDPRNPDDTLVMHKEMKILSQYNIAYKNLPLPVEPYNPDSALKIVEIIKTLPKPMVVHAYFSDKYSAEAFKLTYLTRKQALPPSIFQPRMANGAVVVLNSNCLAGNTPVKSEFKRYLYPKGIRNIAYTGEHALKNQKSLKDEAQKNRMVWEDIDVNDTTKIKHLVSDGTWYFFGSKADDYKKISIFKSNK